MPRALAPPHTREAQPGLATCGPSTAQWALGTALGWQLPPTRHPGALVSVCWWPRGALGSGLLPHHPTQLWVGTSGVPTSQGCCGKDELSSVEWETEAPPRSVGLRGSVCA